MNTYWNNKPLESKYFETVYSETHDRTEYSVIKPLDNPMILFSKIDGTPLASLHLRCQENYKQKDNNGTRGRALITKRPDSSTFNCDFQGLIDRDGQEFELVITNLTDLGYINFNILKKDDKVDTVNPGGLNEINELRPNESYAVKCDQTDNKSLILKAIIKQEKTGLDPELKLTVKEDEEKKDLDGNSAATGSYFYLSVVPQMDKQELQYKFKDTMWACTDLFCIKRQIREKKYGSRFGPPVVAPTPYREEYFAQDPYSTYILDNSGYRGMGSSVRNRENIARSTGYPVQRGSSEFATLYDSSSRYNSISSSRMGAQSGSRRCRMLGRYSSSYNQRFDERFEVNNQIDSLDESELVIDEPKGEAYGVDQVLDEVAEESSEEEDLGGGLISDDWDDWGSDSLGSVKTSMNISSNTVSDNSSKKIIEDSYAAKIEKGSYVQVNGATTGINYDYDVAAVSCVIGLSISEKMEFEPVLEKGQMVDFAKSLVEDLIKNACKQLLERLTAVYKSHQCVICLEGPDEPDNENLDELDVVFYQCGHQCCHYECSKTLRNCPLCRGRIAAKLRV